MSFDRKKLNAPLRVKAKAKIILPLGGITANMLFGEGELGRIGDDTWIGRC